MGKTGIAGLALLLTQCLYTTHHFNTGTTLKPGQSDLAVGIGKQPLWHCQRSDLRDSTTGETCTVLENDPASDTVTINSVFKGSLNYGLGLTKNLGPFPGLNFNWHFEAPTNPLSMEFALKLGLPPLLGGLMAHSLDAGWGVGFWADNSLFTGYALSLSVLSQRLFLNFRGTWLATQAGVVFRDGLTGPFPRSQRWIAQSGTGAVLHLLSFPWVPGIILHAHATYPQLPTGRREYANVDISPLVLNANAGLLWSFQ